MLIAVWCLVMLRLLLGKETDESCDSHLLIVTGRGWTPARKEAIISQRCSYCQNFNTATKATLQGQIKKSLSKLQHTEEFVLCYRLYKHCYYNLDWNQPGSYELFCFHCQVKGCCNAEGNFISDCVSHLTSEVVIICSEPY